MGLEWGGCACRLAAVGGDDVTNVLRFGDASLHGEPNEEIISILEGLLEAARSGELCALAYATVKTNDVLGTGWAGGSGTRAPVAEVIMMLQHRYVAGLLDDR